MRLNEPVTGPTDRSAGGIKRACLDVAPPSGAPGPVYSSPQPHPGLLRVDPATRMQDRLDSFDRRVKFVFRGLVRRLVPGVWL